MSSRHPIAVVSDRTGLSQDILRIWERRYAVVHPERGPNGKRLYSDEDIERLGLMHAATRAGRSIGSVAPLSTEEIAALVDEDADARERRVPFASGTSEADAAISEALEFTRRLDGASLDDRLRRAALAMGVASFLEHVAAPLLRRLGDEWHAGRITPAQEHLASSVLYDLAVQAMRTSAPRTGGDRVLVATPAGDRHAIGAALIGAIAAVHGWSVVYLGTDLPASEIAGAALASGVELVAVSVVYMEDRRRVLGELRALRLALPTHVTLVAGGAGAAMLAPELAALSIQVESSIAGWTAMLRRQQLSA